MSTLSAVSVTGVGLENVKLCAKDLPTPILVRSLHFTDGGTVDL